MYKLKSPLYLFYIIAVFIAISTVLQLFHFGFSFAWGMWIDFVAVPWIIAFFLFGFRPALITSLIMFVVISFVSPSSALGGLMKWVATVPMFVIPAAFLFKKKRILFTSAVLTLLIIGALLITFIHTIANPTPVETGYCYFDDIDPLSSKIDFQQAKFDFSLNFLPIVEILVPFLILIFFISFFSKQSKTQKPSIYSNIKLLILPILLAIVARGLITTVVNYYFAIPIFWGIPTACALKIPWVVIFGLNTLQGLLEVGVAWVVVFKSGLFKLFEK